MSETRGRWHRCAHGDRVQVSTLSAHVFLAVIEAPTDGQALPVLSPDDAQALARRLTQAAITARLDRWPGE